MIINKQTTEAYINGQIDRPQAELILGANEVGQIDYAWQSVEKDIAWGLGSKKLPEHP